MTESVADLDAAGGEDPVAGLLRTLDLVDTGARTDEDIFTGPSEWMPHGRVFGGQVLAQSVIAATRTVRDDRTIHSIHAYFLRPGDLDTPITFGVERIHDGRSFSTRRTQAYQVGLPILSMIASFQKDDPGLDHHAEMPVGIPDPEDLPSASGLLAQTDHPMVQSWIRGRPFELRHVEPTTYLAASERQKASQALWVRTRGPLPDDPDIHRAALAYVSDHLLLQPVLRRHGLAHATGRMRMASLDHAMWWHRDARADEWLLYTQESPSAQAGRGLVFGHMFTRDGKLVATVAQEGMIRVPEVGRAAGR